MNNENKTPQMQNAAKSQPTNGEKFPRKSEERNA